MTTARVTRGIVLGLAAASLCASPIALGVGRATVTCVGRTSSSSSCTAKVSLAGGASNKAITIRLSGTNQKLASVSVPKVYKGAYRFSKGAYSMGGSVYTVTLNAVRSIPKGVYATLTFRAK